LDTTSLEKTADLKLNDLRRSMKEKEKIWRITGRL